MKYLINWWNSNDRINFILILSLGFTGLVLSFSIDENFSLNRHTIFFITSIFLLFILADLENKNIRRISLFSFIILISIMILILFLDYEVKGAKRWFQLLNFTLQPSEIIKPVFVIFMYLFFWFSFIFLLSLLLQKYK